MFLCIFAENIFSMHIKMSKFWPLNSTLTIFFSFTSTDTSILKKCFHISLLKKSEKVLFFFWCNTSEHEFYILGQSYGLLFIIIHFCCWLLSFLLKFFSFYLCSNKKIAASHATLNRIINTKVSLPWRFFIINFSKSRLPHRPQQTVACP